MKKSVKNSSAPNQQTPHKYVNKLCNKCRQSLEKGQTAGTDRKESKAKDRKQKGNIAQMSSVKFRKCDDKILNCIT